MLDSPMIDTAIGLMLFFASLSLIVTAIQEWVSSILKLRGKNLEKGIKQLVGNEITEKVYCHSLMQTMKAKKGKFLNKTPLPSYLKSKYFSQILIDVISEDQKVLDNKMDEIKESINQLPDSNLKYILQKFHVKADTKLEEFEGFISEWFDAGMDRASGWYQRNVQIWLVAISFLVVLLINANTLTVAKSLWKNDNLRTQIATIAEEISRPDLIDANKKRKYEEITQEISQFPIGWDSVEKPINSCWDFLTSLIGWLITTAAISLGAPFWFDLIGKISNIRKSSKE